MTSSRLFTLIIIVASVRAIAATRELLSLGGGWVQIVSVLRENKKMSDNQTSKHTDVHESGKWLNLKSSVFHTIFE